MTLEHVSVVHELKTLGSIAAGDATYDASFDIPTGPDWKPENLKVVVFVQENEGRKVIGVGLRTLNSSGK